MIYDTYNRQTVAIPTKSSLNVKSFLVRISSNNVFDGSSQDMAKVG